MSFTEDMSQLVARTNALLSMFDTKKSEIEAAVAAAIAAAPLPHRELFVDPVGGNDSWAGDITKPVLTLDRALTIASNLRSVSIFLLGDVLLTKRHFPFCQRLEISGVRRDANSPYGVVGETRRLTFAALGHVGTDGVRRVAGIAPSMYAEVYINQVHLQLPTLPTSIDDRSLFGFSFSSSFILRDCAVDAEPGTLAALAGGGNLTVLTFAAGNTTFANAALGHILYGIPAGGNPNTVWHYRSNLTSI